MTRIPTCDDLRRAARPRNLTREERRRAEALGLIPPRERHRAGFGFGVGRRGGGRPPYFNQPGYVADGLPASVIADIPKNRFAVPPLGPELVTNGGFDTNTAGWTAGGGATLAVVGGQLEATGSGGSFPSAFFDFAANPGSVYAITVTLRRGTTVSDAACVVQRTNGSNWSSAVTNSTTSNATQTFYFTAAEAIHRIVLYIASATGSGTAYFDDVSVREVLAGTPQGLGPNLVTNGDFSVGTGWTLGASWSISGGVANKTAPDTILEQQITTIAGRVYEVTATSSFTVFCGAYDNAGASSALSASASSRSGAIRFYFVANDATSWVAFSGANGPGTLDNVTVREVLSQVCPRGSDLITNGAFGTNTAGWTTGGGATIAAVSGQLEVTGAGGSFPSALFNLSGLTVGAVYELVASARRGTSASNALIRFGSDVNAIAVDTSSTTLVTGSRRFVATATSDSVNVIIGSATGSGTIYADDISVCQVFPLLTTAPVPARLRNGRFSDVFSFTASSGPARGYWDINGVFQNNLVADQPRFTWVNGRRRLLLENQSTQLVVWPTALDNAVWIKTRATVSANAASAPDGTVSADKIVEDTSTNTHFIQHNVTHADSRAPVTFSGYFRAAERSFIRIEVTDLTDFSGFRATFNLSTGVVSSSIGIGVGPGTGNASIINAGGGWYRCIVTSDSASVTSTASQVSIQVMTDAVTNNYTGDGTSGVFGWAMQLEALPYATSFIPASGSTVTRAIESARFSPLVEAIFARSAFSAVVQAELVANGVNGRVIGTNTTGILIRNTGLNESFTRNDAAVTIASPGGANTAPRGYAVGLDVAGRSISYDGTAATSDANGSAGYTRTNVWLGRDGVPNCADGLYDTFKLFGFRASGAALQSQAVAYV